VNALHSPVRKAAHDAPTPSEEAAECPRKDKKFKIEKKAVKKAAKRAGKKATKNAKVDRSDASTKFSSFST
jgi:hypothetical protein